MQGAPQTAPSPEYSKEPGIIDEIAPEPPDPPTPPEVELIARTVYGEAAGQHNVPGVMEAIASVIRNRVRSPAFPNTYSGVIHQAKQFDAVGKGLWNAALNPSALRGPAAIAYARALAVAQGVYQGTIPDPTLAATFFHSGPRQGWFDRAFRAGRIQQSIPEPIGPFTFYR